MSGLWQKELRSACPFLVLIIVLNLFGRLYESFSELPNFVEYIVVVHF